MRQYGFTWALIALFTVGGASCGGQSEPEHAREATERPPSDEVKEPEDLGEAMKQMSKALGSDESVEPVDFRSLKALLPEDLPGMKRTSASGQKTGAMGMRVSTAEAKYQPEDGSNGSLTLTITDLGTLRGMAMMGYATWLNMELDRESDTGYERTTKYKGHPAYEKFDRGGSNSRGELSVLVGRRFIVKVEGRGVKMERIKGAMEKIDLGKLDDMKSVGIK